MVTVEGLIELKELLNNLQMRRRHGNGKGGSIEPQEEIRDGSITKSAIKDETPCASDESTYSGSMCAKTAQGKGS